MPRFLRSIADYIDQKDTLPVNRYEGYEGFKGDGSVVLRDRRGTAKAEIPTASEKSAILGSDPLAIFKPTGSLRSAVHAYPDPGLRSIGIEAGRDPPSTTIAG